MKKRDQKPSHARPADARRLEVRREVLRNLDWDLLEGVVGGAPPPTCVFTKVPPE